MLVGKGQSLFLKEKVVFMTKIKKIYVSGGGKIFVKVGDDEEEKIKKRGKTIYE